MSRTIPIALLVSGFVLAAAVRPACGDDQTPQHPPVHHRVHKKIEPLVLPPLPPGPLKPVPMDQIPASAPQVTYGDGMLRIVAENSTLGEILKEVHRLTGATIDLPANGAPERVVTQIGPGAPRDVLATLLNGTSFNYVMLGSISDPRGVESVTLTSRPSGAGEPQAVASITPPSPEPVAPTRFVPPQPFRQQMINRQQAQPADVASADDDSSDDSDDDKDDDSDQAQPAQPQQPAQPGAMQPDNNSANANSGDQPGASPNPPLFPNNGPRTPEQILQMMRSGQPITPPTQQNPPQD